MIIEDQSSVCTFLESQTGFTEQRPEKIETHISIVFIYTDRVFKLKKAVQLPYLDFSTAAVRLHFCKQELALNRRTAPEMYLAVHSIVRGEDGSLAWDQDGELVDAVVEMARFDQGDLLDNLARRGPLENTILDRLAKNIAHFHAALPTRTLHTGSQALLKAQNANERGFAGTMLADDADVMELLAAARAQIIQQTKQLDDRSSAGWVRRCHGDLHLRNICLFHGAPTLFDCLEFDEDLATVDVLYDLAFLLMDLWHRGQSNAANRVFNRYLDLTDDTGALSLMPLFMSVRAAIRGHVTAAQFGNSKLKGTDRETLSRETRSYIDLAKALLDIPAPRLVAIGGLSGSGKSTTAAAIAPTAGAAPGARILSTDRIRKAMYGVGPHDRLPAEAYTQEISNQVYATQRQLALEALNGGWTVVADGVFLRANERNSIEAIARQARVPFAGFWLEAPEENLVARVEARRNDPSDATAEVVRKQTKQHVDVVAWTTIDATHSVDACAEAIGHRLAKH